MLTEAAEAARAETERMQREVSELGVVREAMERDMARLAAELSQVGPRDAGLEGRARGRAVRGGREGSGQWESPIQPGTHSRGPGRREARGRGERVLRFRGGCAWPLCGVLQLGYLKLAAVPCNGVAGCVVAAGSLS